MTDTPTIKNPELVIGLVGPIGVDLEAITVYLENSLREVGYNSHRIHLSHLLKHIKPNWKIDKESYSSRYHSLMDNSDKLRRETKEQAIFSLVSITEIRRIRKAINTKNGKDKDPRRTPATGNAYIIRQFKREEEISLLRKVYGRKFIQISVYLGREERKKQIIKNIKEFESSETRDHDAEKQAIDLIEKDNNEVTDEFGQRVSDVFHLGDAFVIGRSGKDAELIVERFVQAFFGHNGYSPTKTEYGMYAAAGAALRSIDLSRQVGAAIFSKEGEALSLGCNEVPKPFGGTYWCDDAGEKHRDFEEGLDGNHYRKIRIIHDLIERMIKVGLLSEKITNLSSSAAQLRMIMEQPGIEDSKAMDLIEFGRVIHAEMSAITDAARLGRAISGATLFSTTFPCHMCAKHIISSGIHRVVFLEPYPKSHAIDLHSDSITFSPNEHNNKVLFEPFIGISPRRYRDIFEKRKRKDKSGKAIPWSEGEPAPRVEDRGPSYIENEDSALSLMAKLLSYLRED